MSVFGVQVGIALSRPPRTDRHVWFRIEAPTGVEAELIACQWAASHPRVVMPVSALVLDWEES